MTTTLFEDIEREAVVREALTWERTPYQNCGDRKGVGIDCGMILIRAWADIGLIEPFDPRPYPRDFHLHRAEEVYLGIVNRFAAEIPEEQLKLGDIIMFKFGRCFSHGSIYLGNEEIIHAFVKDGMCTRARIDQTEFKDRPRRFFSFWAKDHGA